MPFDIKFNDAAMATLRKNLTQWEQELAAAKQRLDALTSPKRPEEKTPTGKPTEDMQRIACVVSGGQWVNGKCEKKSADSEKDTTGAIDLAKRFEGFERKAKRGVEITAVPYICPAGFWTIGYGHLCEPKHPPITEAEAEVYLARDLQTALAATLRYCPVLVTEPESRLASLLDFTFNLGAGRLQMSTLRRRINQRDWIAAGQELRRWVYGGGKVLPGLVSRRLAEAQLLE